MVAQGHRRTGSGGERVIKVHGLTMAAAVPVEFLVFAKVSDNEPLLIAQVEQMAQIGSASEICATALEGLAKELRDWKEEEEG